MKRSLIFLSMIILSQVVKATTLIEFDSADYTMAAPTVLLKSMEIWISPKAKKISEDTYESSRDCSGCDFLYAWVNYQIRIPLSPALSVYLPGKAVVWSERSQMNGNVATIPKEVMEKDMNTQEVVESVGKSAQPQLNYLASVRRKILVYNKDTWKCYLQGFRGTYIQPSNEVTSFNDTASLVSCP